MAETLKERRSRIKSELLECRGGKCCKCGYAKSSSALCFHHITPADKSFNISGTNLTRIARAKLEEEAKKTKVLCLNCHAELHDEEGWVHEDGKCTSK